MRELVRPFDSTLGERQQEELRKLVKMLYAALIELEDEDKDSMNIELTEVQVMLINQKVGNEDYEGALPLLRQTWAVLFELTNDMPPATANSLEKILNGIHNDDSEAGQS